jgi:hypothetical protein
MRTQIAALLFMAITFPYIVGNASAAQTTVFTLVAPGGRTYTLYKNQCDNNRGCNAQCENNDEIIISGGCEITQGQTGLQSAFPANKNTYTCIYDTAIQGVAAYIYCMR